MILTGRQISEARSLLKLNRSQLAYKIGRVTALVIQRAEEAGDQTTLTPEQATIVRQRLELLGIKFTADPLTVRLRQVKP